MDPERAEAWDGPSSGVLPAKFGVMLYRRTPGNIAIVIRSGPPMGPISLFDEFRLSLLGTGPPGTFHGFLLEGREFRLEGTDLRHHPFNVMISIAR